MLGSQPEATCREEARTLGGPVREKYWKELSIEEKIERLRSLFKSLSNQQDNIASVAHRATAVSENHQHSENGSVLVPVHRNGYEVEAGRRRIQSNPQDPDAVYI